MDQTAHRPASLPYVVGLAGALLIVAMLVWAMQHYTRPAPIGQTRAAERQKFLAELRQADAQALGQLQDQGNGLIRMPIRDAMELLVREFQDPAAARAKMIERVDKATAVPPPAPEKPSEFE